MKRKNFNSKIWKPNIENCETQNYEKTAKMSNFWLKIYLKKKLKQKMLLDVVC